MSQPEDTKVGDKRKPPTTTTNGDTEINGSVEKGVQTTLDDVIIREKEENHQSKKPRHEATPTPTPAPEPEQEQERGVPPPPPHETDTATGTATGYPTPAETPTPVMPDPPTPPTMDEVKDKGNDGSSDGHVQHPENWATGGEPATEKQKGLLGVIAAGDAELDIPNPDELSKSEASKIIADHTTSNGSANTSTTSTSNGNGNATASSTTTTTANGNGNDNGDAGSTVPGDEGHLDHPENWTTGAEPATEKQKGYLKVLEKQTGEQVGDVEGISKSDASDEIDKLQQHQQASKPTTNNTNGGSTSGNGYAAPGKEGAAISTTTNPSDSAHLDHPENWATGGDPATDKQKGFLKVLEKQKGVSVGDVDALGKSEASAKIDELKST